MVFSLEHLTVSGYLLAGDVASVDGAPVWGGDLGHEVDFAVSAMAGDGGFDKAGRKGKRADIKGTCVSLEDVLNCGQWVWVFFVSEERVSEVPS